MDCRGDEKSCGAAECLERPETALSAATWEVRKLFEPFGIVPNHCIDEDLIIRLAWEDECLMRFLGVEIIRENPSDELFGNTVEIVGDFMLL